MTGDRDDDRRGEDFASRWSRLKRERKAPPADTPEPPAEARADDDRSDGEILKELGLPDPDTLKPGDDVKAFMASAVPARIRNRALRKLWTSNPVLANLDRLVDYDDDFTDAATVPAILKTGYKVGRGWLEEATEEEGGETAQGGDRPEDEAAAPRDAAPAADPRADADAAEVHAAGGGPETPAEDGRFGEARVASTAPGAREGRQPAPRRRMRFRFADK